jgi:hypothetical protein
MRILSATFAAWILFPIAAHGQERVPNLIAPDVKGINSPVTQSGVLSSMSLNASATTAATESSVITAVGLDPGATTVDFSTSSTAGFDVFTEPLSGFPTEGSTFLVISSGNTSSAPLPNTSGSTSTQLDGLNNSQGNDMVSISFVMTPPEGAQCLSFNFKFFSEEYPEFVGSSVNDTFIAETPASTFTIVVNDVIAPNNVAFDSFGEPISINTTGVLGMSLEDAFGTTYDGATTTLNTDVPFTVDSNGNLTMIFSIMDLGDSGYDSTAFIDNFRWGNEECDTITDPEPTPTATPDATPTATPTPTPPPPPPGAQPHGLVWVYYSAADDGTPGCLPDETPCGINGEPGDRINLWIDGGANPSAAGEDVCRLGEGGGSGDALCGADMLFEMRNGYFTGIEPEIDTLVCNPSCAGCDEETGICALPLGLTTIRMNFRRGSTAPPAARRRVATIIIDSSGDSDRTPTEIFASGVWAVGANLQLRPIANALSTCTAPGEPFSCCTGENNGNGQWPCGPRMIVPALVPEPGQLWQLMSGLAGLGCLYRLRRRA